MPTSTDNKAGITTRSDEVAPHWYTQAADQDYEEVQCDLRRLSDEECRGEVPIASAEVVKAVHKDK